MNCFHFFFRKVEVKRCDRKINVGGDNIKMEVARIV